MPLNTTHRGTEAPRNQFFRSSVSSVPRCVVIVIAALVAVGSIATAAENTLLDAAERGDRAAALRVLAKGANPNTPGPDGTTPIMWAASNGDLELVRALIKAGADVKAKEQVGTSGLSRASIIRGAWVNACGYT